MTTARPTTLTPTALAERWGCSEGHLANLRSAGQGPAYSKPVGRVIYHIEDIEAYESRGRVEPIGDSK